MKIRNLIKEIENKKSDINLIISGIYKAPRANFKLFKTGFKEIMSKVSQSNKSLFLASNVNINSLDYLTSSIVKQFFNLSFQNGLKPLIIRPIRVSRTSATCIDQTLTNSFMDSETMLGIRKTSISDHFAIFCTIKANEKYHSNNVTTLKRNMNKDTGDFKYLLKIVTWTYVLSNENASEAYDSFFSKFTDLYGIALPKKEVKIKVKNLMSPWITKGLVKSFERKPKLHQKFF